MKYLTEFRPIQLLPLAMITTWLGALSCQAPPAAPKRPTVVNESPALTRALIESAGALLGQQAVRAGEHDPWSVVHPDAREDLPEPHLRERSWRRGVSLGLFASQGTHQEQLALYEELLDEIVAVGATDLSLVVRWSQHDVRSNALLPREGVSVDDALLRDVIRAAKRRDLRLFLLPIIWLDKRAMGVWRGTLAPSDPDAWWQSYTTFILHYARISQEEGVSLFSVGSELLSLETETQRWRTLIRATREVYQGELTYSSNWDHFEVPAFWDALDVVGLTAYQELTHAQNPDVAALRDGWHTFKMRLSIFAREHDLRYIFTEVGYPSHRLGAAYPWNYTPQSLPDHALQARAYRALMESWHEEDRLAGLYLWNWFGFKDPEDRSYTPRGKPAEAILHHWYTRSLPDAAHQ